MSDKEKIIEIPVVYNGELFPWKGHWWKVAAQGMDDDDNFNVRLVITGDKTAGAIKREKKWKKSMDQAGTTT